MTSAPADRSVATRGDRAVDIDAEEPRGARILRECPQIASQLGAAENVGQDEHEHDGQDHDGQTDALERRVAHTKHECGHATRGEGDEIPAVPELHEPNDDERDREARDHRREGRRPAAPKRRERNAIQRDAEESGDQDRDRQGDEPWQPERPDDEQRDERAEHEHRRMSEVQNVEDAEHEREAEREQRVDASDEDRVVELFGHRGLSPAAHWNGVN